MVWDLLGDYDIPNKLGPKKILCNVNNPYGTTTGEKIVLITETGACYLDPEYLTWEEAFDLKYEMEKCRNRFCRQRLCLSLIIGKHRLYC